MGAPDVMSVIDQVMEIVRAQHGPDIARILTYAVATVTVDHDGTLRAHLDMPEDCSPEMLSLLRTECAELLPVHAD